MPALLPPNMVSLGKLLHLSSSQFSSSREGEDQLDHGFCRLVAIMIVALSDPPGSSTGPSWGGSTESEGPPPIHLFGPSLHILEATMVSHDAFRVSIVFPSTKVGILDQADL